MEKFASKTRRHNSVYNLTVNHGAKIWRVRQDRNLVKRLAELRMFLDVINHVHDFVVAVGLCAGTKRLFHEILRPKHIVRPQRVKYVSLDCLAENAAPTTNF